MPNTLVVNLFAGPGAGKSTCAWRLAGELARQGLRVEYVPEYAKELVWDNRMDLLDGSLEHQRMIFEEQSRRIRRLDGKVDVIITDSPILLSSLYIKESSPEFDAEVRERFLKQNHFNLFVNRGRNFDQTGRIHNEAESLAIDDKIQNYLRSHKIFCIAYDRDDIERIAGNIQKTCERINSPAPVQENSTPENSNQIKAFLQERDIKPDERVFVEVSSAKRPKWVRYDLDAIRDIPIQEILSDYGIQIQKNGFFKLRNEHTASAKYYPKTNSWFDFGGGDHQGGGPIQLVMALDGVEKSEAIQRLGKQYRIRELNVPAGAERFNWLSNKDFQMIGVDAQNPMNTPYNLFDAYTKEQSIRLTKAMSLPMNELLEKAPEQYRSILETVAVPFVKEIRTGYYQALDHLSAAEKKAQANALELSLRREAAQQAFDDYEKSYLILRSGAYNVKLDMSDLKPDFERDLKLARQGRLKIEVGEYPYSEFKKLPGLNSYYEMPSNQYRHMQEQIHDGKLKVSRPFSAFQQNGAVNLVFKQPDREYFEDMFQGIEYYVDHILPEITSKIEVKPTIKAEQFTEQEYEEMER